MKRAEWDREKSDGAPASALPEEGVLWKGMACYARSLPLPMAPTPGIGDSDTHWPGSPDQLGNCPQFRELTKSGFTVSGEG